MLEYQPDIRTNQWVLWLRQWRVVRKPSIWPIHPSLYDDDQIVLTKWGSPGVTTVYLPARPLGAHYGASGTYHASASAYLDPALSVDGTGKTSVADPATLPNSSLIDSDSKTVYVGGQCQG